MQTDGCLAGAQEGRQMKCHRTQQKACGAQRLLGEVTNRYEPPSLHVCPTARISTEPLSPTNGPRISADGICGSRSGAIIFKQWMMEGDHATRGWQRAQH